MVNYFYSLNEYGDGYGVFYHTGDMMLEVKTEKVAKESVEFLNWLNNSDAETEYFRLFNSMKESEVFG